jgi:hypothetical protein
MGKQFKVTRRWTYSFIIDEEDFPGMTDEQIKSFLMIPILDGPASIIRKEDVTTQIVEI